CALALASTHNAILILDDIDLDCKFPQLRRHLDQGLWIIATAAYIPTDFGIVDRFPIVLMLNRLHAADLILPPPAEDSAAVKRRIAMARKHQRPNGPDSRDSNSCAPTPRNASCRHERTRTRLPWPPPSPSWMEPTGLAVST